MSQSLTFENVPRAAVDLMIARLVRDGVIVNRRLAANNDLVGSIRSQYGDLTFSYSADATLRIQPNGESLTMGMLMDGVERFVHEAVQQCES